MSDPLQLTNQNRSGHPTAALAAQTGVGAPFQAMNPEQASGVSVQVSPAVQLPAVSSPDSSASGAIIDIGGSRVEESVKGALLKALARAVAGESDVVLPDELLYDGAGHQIWSRIIYYLDYYQTRDEISLFDANGDDIVDRIRPGAVLIDIGSG
jgi:hypothetical protein